MLGNARLYEELERRVEAQRSLGEIAARITAIHDPSDVLQRTSTRRCASSTPMAAGSSSSRRPAACTGRSGTRPSTCRSSATRRSTRSQLDEGVSGRAVLERRVVRTGDYLADPAFTHAEAPDRYIRQHGIRSVMSAPLIGEDGRHRLAHRPLAGARRVRRSPTRSCSRSSPARRPSRSPTPGSTSGSATSRRRSPARPTRSSGCSRSTSACCARSTRPRCSSSSPTA